jgi:DDE superfamily endonuclease.
MEKLSPLVTGKYNKPHCFRGVEHTKYTANSSSWMTSATFEEFHVLLDCQIGAKTEKSSSSLTIVLHSQEIPLL